MLLIIENRREFHTLAQTEPANRSTEMALAHMAWPWPVASASSAVTPSIAPVATRDQAMPLSANEERH